MFEICSKLTIKAQEQYLFSNFEHIAHCFGVSIVDFEPVNAGKHMSLIAVS